MHKFYRDYFWKGGLPYGIGGEAAPPDSDAYKIVMDPYRKRVTLELYRNGAFNSILYDSLWLDFRHLKPEHQTQWQRETVSETRDGLVCLIRNHDDRVILKEETLYEGDLCRECRILSPQGIPLSIHKMTYTALNDPFDGVTLFDINRRPVMRKTYLFDEQSRAFTELLKEEWDFSHA
jgi:hypothetical protein